MDRKDKGIVAGGPERLAARIVDAVRRQVREAKTATRYREPLVAFADASDPAFARLPMLAHPLHKMPEDVLPGAVSVVSFFIPFAQHVVRANAQRRDAVAYEWAVAYVETNDLIEQITDHLVTLLAAEGVRAAAEPPTGNFDEESLSSPWSHKSVAVIAGLGSIGLHHMVITDAGCAGRLGSLVVDARLPVTTTRTEERCLFFVDGSCGVCTQHCPAEALSEETGFDKRLCWNAILDTAELDDHPGAPEVCGKCALGPCSFRSPV